MSAAGLAYRVLGPFDVRAPNGTAVNLGRTKQRALLAVLVIEANRVVSLDRLIDSLWPDDPPAQALSSVHGYISNLRRALDPGRAVRSSDGAIVTHPPGYMLRIGPGMLDAAVFEILLVEGQRLAADGRVEAARKSLDDALALWYGPAFADFAHQPFAVAEALRLEELRLVAVEASMAVELERGHDGRAAAELERLVARNPLRERLYGLLAIALYRSGRQAEALRAIHGARTVLRDELGISLGEELQAIEDDILAQRPSLREHTVLRVPSGAGPDEDRSPAAPIGASVTGPPHEIRVIGREAELAVLDGALVRAVRGDGGIVLVSGEPGIGKTRLVEELARRAGEGGARVTWGRCYDGTGAPPFWPWMQVVRALIAAVGAEDVRDALGSGATDLAPVFPDVMALVGGVSQAEGVDPELIRFRAYDAFVRFLARLSADRPLIVILEDLHWADVASLGLVEFLSGALDGTHLLVVGTYRRAEVPAAVGHPLSRTLAALARRRVPEIGPLPGLSLDSVGQLMEAHLGTAPDRKLVETVWGRSDGNPFFVVELIRLMLSPDRRAPPGHGDVSPHVPTRVRDVLRDRMAGLPDGTAALLDLAAVVGPEFDVDVLQAASAFDAEQLLRLLEGALVTGLVIDDPGVVGRYRFSHALVQETVYEDINALRRARLHLRVGAAMEELRGSDQHRYGQLAFHFTRAASAATRAKAFDYTLRAADAASERLAYEQAIDNLHRALELIEVIPPGRDRDVAELGVQLRLAGWATMTEGWIAPGVAAAWARAEELAGRVGAVRQLLAARWGKWVVALMCGESAGAQAIAAEIVTLSETTDDPLVQLAGACTTGYGRIQRADFRRGMEESDRAADIAAGLEAASVVATFHLHLGVLAAATCTWAAYLSGDEVDACQRGADALSLADRIGHPLTVVAALLSVAMLHVFRGDVQSARRLSEQLIDLSTRHGLRSYVAFGGVVRGWTAVETGDVERGTQEIEQACATIAQAGWVLLRPTCLGLLAQAQWRAGRPDEALGSLDAALAAADAYDDRCWEPELHRLRGDLLASCWPARLDEAMAALQTAEALAARQGARPIRARVAASVARVAGFPAGRDEAERAQPGAN